MKPTKIFMEMKDGRLEFCGGQQAVYEKTLKGVQDKTILELLLQDRKHTKTRPQLNYWYGVLMPFAVEQFLEAGYNELFGVRNVYFVDDGNSIDVGIETTITTVDLLFKRLYQLHKQLPTLPMKRDMTDEQMSELISWTLDWIAKNFEVAAPTAEERTTQ